MLGFSHFYRLNTLILGQVPCFSGIFHIKPFDRPIFLNYPENLHWEPNVSVVAGMHLGMWFLIILELIYCAVFYFLTVYFLQKHLNLE